ncbi:hypothetical protein [Anaeroselena agilis]|uniref:Uncharacterized protein n=1 Tax=Anaeroselena agilis TaxID=3063788 RepID=A0ABU3P5C5_9FIRM|nr:hypothetical protein [Selenomonadales bacterium 4137-cl]
MDDKLFAAIDQLQEEVFAYRPAGINAAFLALVDALEYWVNNVFRAEERPALNRLLELMLTAFDNKDYLLAADLAEYELRPMAAAARKRSADNVTVC